MPDKILEKLLEKLSKLYLKKALSLVGEVKSVPTGEDYETAELRYKNKIVADTRKRLKEGWAK